MPPVKHYSSSEVNQYELSSRLLSLTENTSYTLTQINGQRIYRKAPYAWSGPEPSRNCEVFIGRIPHDCFEDTLVPLFQQAGELFEFRLMINFSGWNRGYAFAMYTNEGEASNAIRMFNNFMIRPSWQLGVCPSINNCRIFISRIPPTTASAEIVRLLYALTDEVQEVRIRRTVASCAAIVEYRSHRGAAMARKALVAAAAAAWGGGARPAVDWSLPQSPQLLRQYREIGRWTAERGVELARAPEEAAPAGGSYALEPWSQARRLRMIRDAQRRAHPHQWSASMEGLVGGLGGLALGGALEAAERAVWAPPGAAPAAPPPRDFNPWTARHPLQEFIAATNVDQLPYLPDGSGSEINSKICRLVYNSIYGPLLRYRTQLTNIEIWVKVVCVSCLVAKRVSQDDEARLSLLLQKLSREWSLLTSVTWDSVGGAFADAVYGGYVMITFGLVLGRIFQEIPRGRRILEAFYLGFGMLFFLVLGGLELASLDSVPQKLVVNASVLGTLSLVVAALFLIDLMGPRTYTATQKSQTELISSPKTDKKVAIIAEPIVQNGNANLANEKPMTEKPEKQSNEKPNGHIASDPKRPKDLTLDIEKATMLDKEDEFLFGKSGYKRFADQIDELEKSKFGSLRNIDGGNYVRLADPISTPDKLHYEQELAKFNEAYFRQYLDSVDGKVSVREGYLPEPQNPLIKAKTSLFDNGLDKKRDSRAKLAPAPTLQQLEEYLRAGRGRRADTPLRPMEPIEEAEDRAAGTPTDRGYVQYAADRWPDPRNLQTPRHSPT